MALRQTAAAIPQPKAGPKCGVWFLRRELDDSDLAWFEEQLAGAKTSVWISQVLKAEDHDVSEYTIQRHRRGKCSCEPA